MGKPREGFLKFCEFAGVTQGRQLSIFKELLEKENLHVFNGKFNKLIQKIKDLILLADVQAKSENPNHYPGMIKIVEKWKISSGVNQVAWIKVFCRLGNETGFCLSLSRARNCYLTFWLYKLAVAKKHAEALGFPEPTPMPNWSITLPQIESVVSSKLVTFQAPASSSVVLLGDTRVPLGEIVDLIVKYSKS